MLTMSSCASLMAVSVGTPISGRAVEKTFTEEGVRIAYQKGTQYYQGFPKLTKSCSYFPVLISRLYRKQLQSIQGLVAKVKGTLANG